MTEENKKFVAPIELYLHSYQARGLIAGRPYDRKTKKHAIPGLTAFAKTARRAWRGAAFNDPWADEWLLKAEARLIDGKKRIEACMNEVEAVFKQLPSNVKATKALVDDPEKIDLRFATPHSYQASYLLAEFDSLASLIFTARHIGLVNAAQASNWYDRGRKANLALYWLAGRYEFTGVSRKDVAEKNAKYEQTVAKRGEIDADILSRKLQPEHMPPVRNSEAVVKPEAEAEKGKPTQEAGAVASSIDELL